MQITRELLERFGRGQCSPEERGAVERWADDASWPWYAPEGDVPPEIREAVWERLREHTGIRPPRIPRRRRTGIWLAAAACAAIILASLLLTRSARVSPVNQEVTFTTNYREHKKIMLSDSSVVFLSPGSSIRLVQPFPATERRITLTGQAIFEAAHDAKRPFRVVSGDLVTTALGTSFKVTSFPGTGSTRVALSYGKVVVEEKASGARDALYLDPGEEAVYDNQTRSIRKTADRDTQFNFRDNILYFKNADLKEVVSKLSEYYHMPVHYDALKDANWSVSGEFDYQPVSIVLQAIAYSCNIRYEIRNREIYLQPIH